MFTSIWYAIDVVCCLQWDDYTANWQADRQALSNDGKSAGTNRKTRPKKPCNKAANTTRIQRTAATGIGPHLPVYQVKPSSLEPKHGIQRMLCINSCFNLFSCNVLTATWLVLFVCALHARLFIVNVADTQARSEWNIATLAVFLCGNSFLLSPSICTCRPFFVGFVRIPWFQFMSAHTHT